jgi:hypothetical protein
VITTPTPLRARSMSSARYSPALLSRVCASTPRASSRRQAQTRRHCRPTGRPCTIRNAYGCHRDPQMAVLSLLLVARKGTDRNLRLPAFVRRSKANRANASSRWMRRGLFGARRALRATPPEHWCAFSCSQARVCARLRDRECAPCVA